MINAQLHRQPVSIDRDQHRHIRMRLPLTDWSITAQLNSIFVAVAEFSDACRDYPLVFINAGNDEQGKVLFAPIAVLGLANAENLYLDGSKWRGGYIPAVLRAYPFFVGRVDAQTSAVCLDASWSQLSQTEGEPLFLPDGEPAPLLITARQQLELIETEVQRTRMGCQRLAELDLLREMRFDATLPDGRKHSVDGFFTIDQERVQALDDAAALELHKSGLLAVIHAHWVSLGNMRALVEWFVQRHPKTAEATPT